MRMNGRQFELFWQIYAILHDVFYFGQQKRKLQNKAEWR